MARWLDPASAQRVINAYKLLKTSKKIDLL